MDQLCETIRPRITAAVSPRRQRSIGRATVGLSRIADRTHATEIHESGPYRIRLPRHSGPALEAVLLNTAGGIACGDAFDFTADCADGTDATITTPASERVYRSDGAVSTISARLELGAGARLAWLPQETIIYDRAKLERRLDVDMHADAVLTLFEALTFGRAAHGERLASGHVRDIWRVRRAGRLVFADTLRLDGDIAGLIDRPAILGGAGATASIVHIAPDAEGRLEEARDLLAGAPAGSCGAGAWNGMLVARFIASDSAALRAAAIPLIIGLTGRPLPRVWQS